MSLGFSLNKYKNAVVLKAKTPEALLETIQKIKCPVEIVQVYYDNSMHIAWIITEKRLVKKIK